MDIPTSYTEKFRPRARLKNQPRNEREELLDRFLSRLNPPRVDNGFKTMSHARIAKVLEKVPTADLHAFYRQCDGADSFSRLFWFKVKPARSEGRY
jgi:hypothetical protein